MGRGEFALAKEHLLAAIDTPSNGWNPMGVHEVYILLADMGAQQRDRELLSAYARRSAEFSEALNHQLYSAVALRALGILDWLEQDFARAEERLKASWQVFQLLDTQWQIGRTLFDLADLSAGMGKEVEAKTYSAQAQAAFRAMGISSGQDVSR